MNNCIELFLDDYTVPPADFCWRHCYIVDADGGARSDFITAWLSRLQISQPLKDPWNINAQNGKTCMHWSSQVFDARLFRQAEDTEFLNWLLEHQSDSAPIIAQKTHHGYLIPKSLSRRLFPFITLIDVTIDLESVVTVAWEFIVKTYLFDNFDLASVGGFFPVEELEKITTTEEKRCIIEKLFRLVVIDLIQSAVRGPVSKWTPMLTIKRVAYKDITNQNGSYLLAELLGLEVSSSDHKLWARSIQMAKAPLEITALGKTWSIAEVEQIYNTLLPTMVS
jgi:hypothetical protein